MSERLRQGLQLRNKRENGDRPLKGKDQAEREELSPTRSRREDHSKRTGSHRLPRESSGRGRSLTRRRRLQAPPKKKPADRRQSRAGGPGSGPTARGAQWREPRTSLDPQLQWGPPGKRAPAAAELQGASRATDRGTKPQSAESRAGYPRQPQTHSKGRGGNTKTPTWDSEEHWRELRTT